MSGFLLSALLFCPLTRQARAESAAAQSRQTQIGVKIAAMEHDPDYYAADASAEIKKGDADAAYDQAYHLALERLAEAIQVTVTVASQNTFEEKKTGWWDKQSHDVKNKVQARANLVLTDPENSLYVSINKFPDYPQKSFIDVLVSVPKQKYRELAARKSALEKNGAETLIASGAAALAAKNVVLALRDFLAAKAALIEAFGAGTPVEIQMAGRKTEAQGLLDSRINTVLGGISIKPPPSRVVYTAQGEVNETPQVQVLYSGSGGKEIPVRGLALKADFMRGDGSLSSGDLETDAQGIAQLPLSRVDPSQAAAAIEVSVDAARLSGADGAALLSAAALPECVINLSKARSVAYAVNAASSRQSISEAVRRILITDGFSTALQSGRDPVLSQEIRLATQRHADYFLAVSVKSETQKMGDYDLFKAQAQSSLSLYALPDGEPVFDVAGPSAQGVGTSPVAARGSAVAKIIPALAKLLEAQMAEVK